MGQTVEKPWGCLEKLHPGEESEAMGFSEGKPEGAARGFAFGKSRGIQALPRGSFTDNPKAFQQFVRLWFPRGAGTDSPKGVVWKNFKKAAVKSAHCKSQTAPIGNQSLLRSVLVKQANPRLRRCPNTSVP